MSQKAEKAQAIVDGDDHRGGPQRPARGELGAVVVVRFTVHVSAAMDPDQDSVALAPASEPCREDVQVEAVLVDVRRPRKHPEFGHLRTGVCKLGRIQRFVPMLDGLRRHPAQRADRGSRIRDAQELVYPVLYESTNRTLGSPNDRSIFLGHHRNRKRACCQQ